MLGDTAVMVHPEDERYTHLIGQQVRLPLTERLIPVIADAYVDKAFGTGVVKVTPAHDTNDYQVGLRHGLPMLTIFTLDAKVNDEAPGLPRPGPLRGPQAGVADLEAQGLLVETKKHKLMVPRCARTGQVIEPMLTDQWFVATTKPGRNGKSIAEGAIEAVASGEVQVRARELGQHLQPVDEEHPGLVHQPPALVGSPDPRLVRRGRPGLRGAQRGRGAAASPRQDAHP
jgi:valyl-tRNA synthetase